MIHGNLDDIKTEAPIDAPENMCGYCGEECENDFCSESCYKAWLND